MATIDQFVHVTFAQPGEGDGYKYRMTLLSPAGMIINTILKLLGRKITNGVIFYFNEDSELKSYLTLFRGNIHMLRMTCPNSVDSPTCYGNITSGPLVVTTARIPAELIESESIMALNPLILDEGESNICKVELIGTEDVIVKSMIVGDVTAGDLMPIKVMDIHDTKEKVNALFKSLGHEDLRVILTCRKVVNV